MSLLMSILCLARVLTQWRYLAFDTVVEHGFTFTLHPISPVIGNGSEKDILNAHAWHGSVTRMFILFAQSFVRGTR